MRLATLNALLPLKPFECTITLLPSVDIPYRVTQPLPPIFASNLCWRTKQVHLYNSAPDLSRLLWVSKTEEDTIQEQAEEAHLDLYDREVSLFYEEAKKKASEARVT